MEATRPAGANLLQQQAKFDVFIEEFKSEKPARSSLLPAALIRHSGTHLRVAAPIAAGNQSDQQFDAPRDLIHTI
jgi:hypothetical protein